MQTHLFNPLCWTHVAAYLAKTETELLPRVTPRRLLFERCLAFSAACSSSQILRRLIFINTKKNR